MAVVVTDSGFEEVSRMYPQLSSCSDRIRECMPRAAGHGQGVPAACLFVRSWRGLVWFLEAWIFILLAL